MHKNLNESIVRCPVFESLNFNEIESLIGDCDCRVKTFKKDESIVREGEECRQLKIILKGSVKGEMMDFSGKIIKIEDIYPPNPLAPAFLFGNNTNYPVNITTNENTEILSIPRDEIVSLMLKDKRILLNYLNFMSNRAQFLSRKLKFLSFQSVKGKIAHYILDLSKKQGDHIILDKSQNELSVLFGITRPSLGRAIRQTHNNKLISARGKEIRILNKTGLSGLMK